MSSTVADVIAEELREAGVDRVFGLPGGEVLALIDALRRSRIDFVLCRHEANAGLMASVYGKLKGVPGVVLTTLGPGASNLMLPIANSRLDREPLVAISAQISDAWAPTRTHQRLPLLEIYQPVTKLARKVDASNCRAAVREAFAVAHTEPAGPAYLTISSDVARASWAAATSSEPDSRLATASLQMVSPDAAAAEVRSRVASSQRPVLAIGMGAHVEHAGLIRQWVDDWRLPVVVTPKIKGIIDETHELFAGVISGMALDATIVKCLALSDLIVGLGLDPAEIDGDWHDRFPLLWLMDSPWATGELPTSNLIACQHDHLIEALLGEPVPRGWINPVAEAQTERDRIMRLSAAPNGFVSPIGAVRSLAAGLPPETIITIDVGSHKYVFGQFWPSHFPGTFLVSNGLSGMGYGLPAAIAAKLARPDQPVLSVVGDGGFSMNSQELETARRVGAHILVAVLSDSSYSLIQMSQRRQGLDRYGVDFNPIDTVLTARACGVDGSRITSEPELKDWAQSRAATRTVSVVEIPVRDEDYAGLV